jgi:hypothetical protein
MIFRNEHVHVVVKSSQGAILTEDIWLLYLLPANDKQRFWENLLLLRVQTVSMPNAGRVHVQQLRHQPFDPDSNFHSNFFSISHRYHQLAFI